MRGDEGRSVGQFDEPPDGGGTDAVKEWFGGHGDLSGWVLDWVKQKVTNSLDYCGNAFAARPEPSFFSIIDDHVLA